MPRFYFHTHGPNHCIPDHEGIELDDVATARGIALLAAVDALDDIGSLKHHLDWRFEISDDAGKSILTIPFSECALAWGFRRASSHVTWRKRPPSPITAPIVNLATVRASGANQERRNVGAANDE